MIASFHYWEHLLLSMHRQDAVEALDEFGVIEFQSFSRAAAWPDRVPVRKCS